MYTHVDTCVYTCFYTCVSFLIFVLTLYEIDTIFNVFIILFYNLCGRSCALLVIPNQVISLLT